MKKTQLLRSLYMTNLAKSSCNNLLFVEILAGTQKSMFFYSLYVKAIQ